MAESIQHKLDRIRPPRVQLTYDLETGDSIQTKELPFVMGILADLAGKPADTPSLLRDRKFVEIDGDSFNEVMASIKPRLAFSVSDKLKNDNSTFGVELHFTSMDDFSPVSVVKQIPQLAQLYEARVRLNDLVAKLDGNDELEHLLNEVIANADTRNALLKDLTPSDAAASPGAGGAGA